MDLRLSRKLPPAIYATPTMLAYCVAPRDREIREATRQRAVVTPGCLPSCYPECTV